MKKKITWTEFDECVSSLEQMLKGTKNLAKNIYGVPRGGLIPAVMLSHRLDLPLITQQRLITKETIVVDDIIDTGKTIQRLLKKKKPFALVALWYHPKAKVVPDYFARLKATEDWLVFPFETLSSSKYDKTV